MKIVAMSFDCEKPGTLEDQLGRALRDTLGAAAEDLRRVEAYLEALPGKDSRCRIQVNAQPYGSLGAGYFEAGDARSLHRALAAVAWQARMAVRQRVAATARMPERAARPA